METILQTAGLCASCDARCTFNPSWIRTSMKTNSTLSYLKNLSLFFSMIILMAVTQSCSVTENVNATETKNARASRREREVKIYPGMWKRVMHVKNAENEQIDFFVFDTDGTIMVHYKMKEKDHKKINGLEKGTYIYQVFKNDEMSDVGKIVVK
jgi:hypothetical protein